MDARSSNPGIPRACPVCQDAGSIPVLEKGGLRLVRCASCSMVYASPVQADLASGEFYDRLSLPFYLSPDKLAGDYAPVRFNREIRLFRRHCPSGSVLDVGCSTGGFLHRLKTLYPGDYEVCGTDVAESALDHARTQGIEVIRAPFPTHDFGGRRFDAVTFWAVIEHLVSPASFLNQAARVLQPGGSCFVLVPNFESLAVRILGARYRYLMPDHVNYFTRRTLKRWAASEPAFEVTAQGGSHFNPLVILQDFRSGEGKVSGADRARLLRRTTGYKQNPWLRPVGWLYSGAEHLLAACGLADNLHIILRKKP